MARLFERFKTKRFRLGVKQHALVLEFTTAIEDAMNALGIRQSDLAGRLGKSRSWVSKIFRKTPNLTFFTAVAVADALNMDVELSVTPRAQADVGPVFVTGRDLAPAWDLASSFVSVGLLTATGLVVNSLSKTAMHAIASSAEVSAGVAIAVAPPSQPVAVSDPQSLAA